MKSNQSKPLFIGIAGAPGVGKTTLSKALKQFYPDFIEVVHLDDYIFPKMKIRKLGLSYSHPQTVDCTTFLKHLYMLCCGKSVVHAFKYSFAAGDIINKKKTLCSRPIIVCEGWVLFYYKKIRDLFDIRIYLDLSGRVERIQRMVNREKQALKTNVLSAERMRYLTEISPIEYDHWVKSQKIHADYIFNSSQKLGSLVNMVAALAKMYEKV